MLSIATKIRFFGNCGVTQRQNGSIIVIVMNFISFLDNSIFSLEKRFEWFRFKTDYSFYVAISRHRARALSSLNYNVLCVTDIITVPRMRDGNPNCTRAYFPRDKGNLVRD